MNPKLRSKQQISEAVGTALPYIKLGSDGEIEMIKVFRASIGDIPVNSHFSDKIRADLKAISF